MKRLLLHLAVMYPEMTFFRLMRKMRVFSPIIIFTFTTVVFIMGIWGYYLEHEGKPDFNAWGAIYAVVSMFLMESVEPPYIANWQLVVAKYVAAILLGYGIFITISRYLYTTWVAFKIKTFYRQHVVVLGAGKIGSTIAAELLQAGELVVIIDNNPQNEHLMHLQSLGGLVVVGSALEENDLFKIGIHKARLCVVVLGNDETNLEATNLLTQLNQQGKFKEHLKVHVNVNDWYNITFLKDYLDTYTKTENFDIDTFDTDYNVAQYIFDKFSPVQKVTYQKIIDQTSGKLQKIHSSDNSIAIIGFNAAAENFVVECIILSHVPGLRNLKVLLIEKDVEQYIKQLYFKFPFIADYLDIIPVELTDENFYGEQFTNPTFLSHIKVLSYAYIFGNHDAYLLGLASRFRQFLYATIGDVKQVDIVVCLPENSKVMSLIDPAPTDDKKDHLFETLQKEFSIHVIQQITDTCTKSKLIDSAGVITSLAKTVNYFYAVKYEFEWLLDEVDRKIYQNLGLDDKLEKIFLAMRFKTANPTQELENAILGEMSRTLQKPQAELVKIFGVDTKWNQLSDIKQDSNRYVARHLEVKVNFLQRVGHTDFTKEVIEGYLKVLAPIEHKRWNSEKLSFKFRYGAFPKDKHLRKMLKETLKIHDQIITYEALDKEMEDKDLNMFLLIPVMQSAKEAILASR